MCSNKPAARPESNEVKQHIEVARVGVHELSYASKIYTNLYIHFFKMYKSLKGLEQGK